MPDFYQGTEFWDFSLVDPTTAARSISPAGGSGCANWRSLTGRRSQPIGRDGRIKFALMRWLLALRNTHAELFTHGAYRPVEVSGPDADEIVAFARIKGRDALIVVAATQFGRASADGQNWPSPDLWDASLNLSGFTGFTTFGPSRAKTSAPYRNC